MQSLIALTVQTHSDLGSGGNIEFYINQYYVPNTLLLPGTPGKIIKCWARSCLHHHFFLEVGTESRVEGRQTATLFRRIILVRPHFHHSPLSTAGHTTRSGPWLLRSRDWCFSDFLLPGKRNRGWSSRCGFNAGVNELTRCYWNLSWKCYSQDSRLTSSELRKPFNSTGIQTLGRCEQVGLDGIVCCLSNCHTPLCSKRLLYLRGLHWARRGGKKEVGKNEEKKKPVCLESNSSALRPKAVSVRGFKSSLGLDNKQKEENLPTGRENKVEWIKERVTRKREAR